MSKVECQHITLALKLLILNGNQIKEISQGWTIAKEVIHMFNPLDSFLKKQILLEISELKYSKSKASPHFPATEDFFCNECKIGISFPVK